MSDPEQPEQQPDPSGIPPGGFSLGDLNAGEFDTSLKQPESAADSEQLDLPPGAFVAMRKSGGMRFSSRTVVVYRSGRIETSSIQAFVSEQGAPPIRLSSTAVQLLERLVQQSGLARRQPIAARPSADGYSYELVARAGRRLRRATLYDGSIPAPIRPLLNVLQRLIK